MRCTNETRVSPGRGAGWLPCLAACLVFAGAAGEAGAGPAQTAAKAPAQAAHKPGKHDHKTSYKIVTLNAGDFFALPRINDSGQVSYSVQMGMGSPRGYFYDGAVLHDIGTLGGTDTYAVALNNAGQVTGRSTIPGGNEHAFVWSLGGGMLDLGVLPGAANSAGMDINNLGVVVGMSEGTPLVAPRAFRWSAVDGMENLGAFTAGLASFSSAKALNDAGLVAGDSTTAAFDRHAFRWTPLDGLVDIDTLGSSTSLPVAVGAQGQIGGTATFPGIVNRAFLWTAGTGMLDLGTGGGLESVVIAMSRNAHIAGVLTTMGGDRHAMSWTQATGMLDLGTLGGSRSRAQAVNGKGAVVGSAETRKEDVIHGFIWTKKSGMVDLNKRLRHAPPGFVVEGGLAINDSGTIVAITNAGVVLLEPGHGRRHGRDKDGDAHVLGPIAAPGLVRLGATVQATLGFVDEDRTGTRSVSWSWGDGSALQAARVREAEGEGSAGASHRYDAAGIHTITVKVLDRAGRSTEAGRTIVAHDPVAGALAGNGRVDSPLGALRAQPLFAGSASFALIAHQGVGAAGGPGQLHFTVPGLALRSDRLEPADLPAGRGRLAFQGSGTVNGRGDYRFTLVLTGAAAGTGERGRIGLKIWHADPVSKEEVVDYDNQGDVAAGADAAAAVAGARGPRVAAPRMTGPARLHPAGGRIVEGGIAYH